MVEYHGEAAMPEKMDTITSGRLPSERMYRKMKKVCDSNSSGHISIPVLKDE